MKRVLHFVFFSVFLLSALPKSQAAMQGNEGGHAGDPYALEFTTIGSLLPAMLKSFQAAAPSLFSKWKFTPDDFARVVSSTRVVSDEAGQVILRGQEVDAINSTNQILINRGRWREDDLHARVQLVFHEYLGILGVEQDRYDASIDFGSFILDATNEVEAQSPSSLFMANIFYGRCINVPSLIDTSSCEDDPAKLAQIKNCAQIQAEGKCRLSGKSQCEVISAIPTTTVSSTVIGLRYCEVLVLMK